MYNSLMKIIEWALNNVTNSEKRTETFSNYECATAFEFILYLFLMITILTITNILSRFLQRKDKDILSMMRLVRIT